MDPHLAAHLPGLVWLLVCSALVFFMQAGFAAVESGSVRWKNSINVALKNVIDLCCSFAAFFVIGYGLMFGASWMGLIGAPDLFLASLASYDPKGTDAFTAFPIAFFLWQATFCATAATIVSGAVAERCRFMAYVIVSIGIAVVIYPVFGHWAWSSGGWLVGLGYHDFAGSSVVHLLGAGISLAGVQVLGARQGRFAADGTPQAIPASSMTMVALGVCFLAFGWIGFNGGSAALSADTPLIIVNTLIAACFGGLAVMLWIWATRGVPQADLILNGVLGGLVAITACANVVAMPAAAAIGLVGGAAVVLGTRLLDRWRLDDAVGAIPVHGFAGICGVLCTALFADAAWLEKTKQMSRLEFFGIQALGCAVCLAWAYAAGMVLWWITGRMTGLRIGRDEEAVGMNYSEHKVADPVLDLAAAATAVAQGKAADIELDNVREGDLVPLARAVRTLVQRQRDAADKGQAWAGVLTDLRSVVGELQHVGGTTATATRAELQRTRESLDAVAGWLAEHRDGDRFAPVLASLIDQLRTRLDAAAAGLPRIGGALDRLGEVGGTLERLGGEIPRRLGGAR
ncbi:MAG: hypothetical protein RLZZ127_375 [Planctomycetota bacterium]|jgi:Amt family ammonium transporter